MLRAVEENSPETKGQIDRFAVCPREEIGRVLDPLL